MHQLRNVRAHLLELHKALVDAERGEYEALHGRQTAGAFLSALLDDAVFAWLHRWTALIVRIDEALDLSTKDPEAAESERRACLLAVNALVTVAVDADGHPQQRYGALLLSSPDVAVAHGALVRALHSGRAADW